MSYDDLMWSAHQQPVEVACYCPACEENVVVRLPEPRARALRAVASESVECPTCGEPMRPAEDHAADSGAPMEGAPDATPAEMLLQSVNLFSDEPFFVPVAK